MLNAPKFWMLQAEGLNSKANSQKKGEKGQKYVQEWAFVRDTDCNLKTSCKNECKKRKYCRIFVMKTDEGIVRIRKTCNNVKLPVRGSEGAAGYDLAAAQPAVVHAYGKVLVKIGLSMSMSTGCYGRITPRSGVALKKFIDVGQVVIDADYRGEIGVILFNFEKEDFEAKMGDKIAQIIFEKIKTPEIVVKVV